MGASDERVEQRTQHGDRYSTCLLYTSLYNAKVYLETADLFAWTAVIILLSVLLERMMLVGFDALTKRLSRMKREVRE